MPKYRENTQPASRWRESNCKTCSYKKFDIWSCLSFVLKQFQWRHMQALRLVWNCAAFRRPPGSTVLPQSRSPKLSSARQDKNLTRARATVGLHYVHRTQRFRNRTARLKPLRNNKLPTVRTQKIKTPDTKAHHWTRFWASSIQLWSSPHCPQDQATCTLCAGGQPARVTRFVVMQRTNLSV